MINKKVLKELNIQINKEIYSSYLYLAMSAYSSSIGLSGFATWFNAQVQEELAHAKIMYDYILQHGEKVVLDAIEKPQTEWKSPKHLFEHTLEHEKFVSERINMLYNLARDERDNASEIILQWFVSEQVEEEASADEILQKLKLLGDDKSGLFMIDAELSKRVFTPPSILKV